MPFEKEKEKKPKFKFKQFRLSEIDVKIFFPTPLSPVNIHDQNLDIKFNQIINKNITLYNFRFTIIIQICD